MATQQLQRTYEVEPTNDVIGSGELKISFTSKYELRYRNIRDASPAHVTFWHPVNPVGLELGRALGSLLVPNWDDRSDIILTVMVDADPGSDPVVKPAVADPTGYNLIWTDKNSHAEMDGSVWQPIPPEGYVAMGCVAMKGYEKPLVDQVYCVRRDLVVEGQIGSLLWSNRGSTAAMHFSGYSINPISSVIDDAVDGYVSLAPGTFVGYNKYFDTPQSPPSHHPLAYLFRSPASMTGAATPLKLPSELASDGTVPRFGDATRKCTMSLPWYGVKDDQHTDVDRSTNFPTYLLQRTDRYKRITEIENSSDQIQKQTHHVTTTLSFSQEKSLAEETGISVSVGLEVQAGSEALGFGVTASTQVTSDLNVTETSSTSVTSSTETGDAYEVNAGPKTIVAGWLVESTYQLFRQDKTLVTTQVSDPFEIDNYPETFVIVEYPLNDPNAIGAVK